MKLKYFFIFLFFTNLIISQNSKKGYRITYNLTYSPDSLNVKKTYNENFLLFVSKRKSRFISKSNYLADSLIYYSEKNSTDPILAMNAAVNLPHTKFQYIIYKELDNNKLIVYDQIFTDLFKYEEKLNSISWKIEKETAKISGYTCQKATTKYAGRKYIAWFTNNIPISDGPYKFSGLPGLIIKISDIKKQYIFTLIGIEKSFVDLTQNRTKEKIINTSKTKFYKALKDFNENMEVRIQNNPNFNFGKIKRKKKPINNPIELKLTNL